MVHAGTTAQKKIALSRKVDVAEQLAASTIVTCERENVIREVGRIGSVAMPEQRVSERLAVVDFGDLEDRLPLIGAVVIELHRVADPARVFRIAYFTEAHATQRRLCTA